MGLVFSKRTLGFNLLLLGQASCFIGLLAHWDRLQRNWGTAMTAVLITLSLLIFFISTAFQIWLRQRPSVFLSHTLGRLSNSPGFLSTSIFLGLVALSGMLFYHSLLSLFISLPVFFISLSAILSGISLILYERLPGSTIQQIKGHLLLMAIGLMVGLSIFEVGGGIINSNLSYLILQPNAREEFILDTEIIPGVSQHIFYTTNSIGIRGDDYQGNGRYNILAIGGSTTETAFLDDSETWSHLLQNNLNLENGRLPDINPDTPVWVGNVGKSGHGLVEHIHALEFFVPQYKVDAVILLVGINDFMPIIQLPNRYHDHYEDPTNYAFYLHRSFYSRPLVDKRMMRSFPENTIVWNVADIATWNFLSRSPKDIVLELPDVNSYTIRRTNYLAAPLINELPDLEPALQQYRANLLKLIALAEIQNIRLVFATQPAVWHEDLSPEMTQLLWFGFQGDIQEPDGRYEIMDLSAGLDQFNQILLDVCQEQAVECVDIAAEMNGQEDFFYDDIHFNKAGGAKIAELLASHFSQETSQND